MAALDAVLSPEWQYRSYSFDARWADGAKMASMRNGSGDTVFLVFDPAGLYVQGLDHESVMARATLDPSALDLFETPPSSPAPPGPRDRQPESLPIAATYLLMDRSFHVRGRGLPGPRTVRAVDLLASLRAPPVTHVSRSPGGSLGGGSARAKSPPDPSSTWRARRGGLARAPSGHARGPCRALACARPPSPGERPSRAAPVSKTVPE